MSSSEERTPTISPDPGATGETTTSSENKEAGTQTGLSEEEEEAHYKEEYNNAVFKLLKNISMQDPELGRDIVMESLLKHYATEIRSKRSEEPDFLHKTEEEFETYLALLKEVRNAVDITWSLSQYSTSCNIKEKVITGICAWAVIKKNN